MADWLRFSAAAAWAKPPWSTTAASTAHCSSEVLANATNACDLSIDMSRILRFFIRFVGPIILRTHRRSHERNSSKQRAGLCRSRLAQVLPHVLFRGLLRPAARRVWSLARDQ